MSESDSGNNQSNGFDCPSCDKTLPTKQGMRAHHTSIHDKSLVKEEIEDGYNCPSCDSQFPTKSGMKCHHTRVHGESLVYETIECLNCGESAERRKDQLERSERTFCSRSCFFEYRRENGQLTTVKCTSCGGELERYQSRTNKYDEQFCDVGCMSDWMDENAPSGADHPRYKQIPVDCSYCGGEFTRLKAYIERYDNVFCSKDCRWSWQSENAVGEDAHRWEGGEVKYGAGWTDAKKERVRERDGRECQNCGRDEESHIQKFGTKHTVHHIQKARTFDDYEKRHDMDNLVTLCRGECHWRWEKLSPLRPQVD